MAYDFDSEFVKIRLSLDLVWSHFPDNNYFELYRLITVIMKKKLFLFECRICIIPGNFSCFFNSVGSRHKCSNSSFLFSLRNKDNLAPFIANIQQGQGQCAIYCYSGYGPIFGGGHDLYICNNAQVNQSSYSTFGHTYRLPPGYVYNSEQAKNLLAGQYWFKTTEIEGFN